MQTRLVFEYNQRNIILYIFFYASDLKSYKKGVLMRCQCHGRKWNKRSGKNKMDTIFKLIYRHPQNMFTIKVLTKTISVIS